MRKFFGLLLTLALLGQFFGLVLLSSPQKARANSFSVTERAISTNAADQWIPQIYGDKIIWMDFRNPPNFDCYLYNLATSSESKITNLDCEGYGTPSIYGETLVTAEGNIGTLDIYTYNLLTSTKTQVTDEAADQTAPSIYEDKIVWAGERNGNWDIYLYNLSTTTEIRITDNASISYVPAIYGDKIVYTDNRNGGQSDIYLYNLTTLTETRITADLNAQDNPKIYGDKIVWEDYRNGLTDIYMYNLSTSTEGQITTDSHKQALPEIYGSKIVWEDDRNNPGTYSDVYLYDLDTSTETLLTPLGSNQEAPDIYDNKIVWMDDRNDPGNSYDIYMATLSYPTSGGNRSLSFENLPGSSAPVNLEDGQTIDTPIYTLEVKPYSKAGIEKVEFYIDNNLICTDTEADENGIYSCDWDTTKYHTVVKIIAYAKNGLTSTIERIVNIDPQVYASTITTLPETGADLIYQ